MEVPVRDRYRNDLDRAPHACHAERFRRQLASCHDQRGPARDPCPVLTRFPTEVPVGYPRELPEWEENRWHGWRQISRVNGHHRKMNRPEAILDRPCGRVISPAQ